MRFEGLINFHGFFQRSTGNTKRGEKTLAAKLTAKSLYVVRTYKPLLQLCRYKMYKCSYYLTNTVIRVLISSQV